MNFQYQEILSAPGRPDEYFHTLDAAYQELKT